MRRLSFVLTVLLFTALAAGTALASEGGDHPLPWGNFALRIVNFALFIGIPAFFAGKKIKGFLRGRSQGIATELATLERKKAQAIKDLEDMEKRIAGLEDERQAILREYKEQGETIRARLIVEAEADAARIAEQAQRTAEQEYQLALEGIRAEIADLMEQATERLLPQRLTQDEQNQLVRKYLTKVVLN